MTNLELFQTLGSVTPENLAEAEEMQFRPREARKHPKSRILLIAAMVAMLALLTTACAVVYSRIHMQLVRHNPVPTTQTLTENRSIGAGEPATAVPNVLTACYPQQLPEGYRMGEGHPVDYASRNIYYWNDAGAYITFSVSTDENSDMHLAPPVTETALNISGWEALLCVSEKGAQVLQWHDEDLGCYLTLFTQDMAVDLPAMAETVALGEELPLTFLCKQGTVWDIWYPQQLPDGYACTDVGLPANGSQALRYTSENGDAISYVVSLKGDLREDIGEPPHDSFVWEELTVGEQPAKMMTTSGGLRMLFWENKAEGFYAMLDTTNEDVDLLAIAQSVAPGEHLEVSGSYLGPDYTIDLQQDPATYVGFEPVYPQRVPEGYSAAFISDPAYGQQQIEYENLLGDRLVYTLYFRLGQWGRQFEGMGEPEQVSISGKPGYKIGNTLIWTDEAKGFGFCLQSTTSLDLISIAEGVGPGPELRPTNADKTDAALRQLGDYQITALPESMVEDGLTGMPLEDGSGWYSYVRRWYFDHGTNHAIYFEYESYVSEGTSPEELALMYVGDAGTVENVTICGCPGATSQDREYASVAWIMGDGTKGTEFKLFSTDYTTEELLPIAQSVALVSGE